MGLVQTFTIWQNRPNKEAKEVYSQTVCNNYWFSTFMRNFQQEYYEYNTLTYYILPFPIINDISVKLTDLRFSIDCFEGIIDDLELDDLYNTCDVLFDLENEYKKLNKTSKEGYEHFITYNEIH